MLDPRPEPLRGLQFGSRNESHTAEGSKAMFVEKEPPGIPSPRRRVRGRSGKRFRSASTPCEGTKNPPRQCDDPMRVPTGERRAGSGVRTAEPMPLSGACTDFVVALARWSACTDLREQARIRADGPDGSGMSRKSRIIDLRPDEYGRGDGR